MTVKHALTVSDDMITIMSRPWYKVPIYELQNCTKTRMEQVIQETFCVTNMLQWISFPHIVTST